MSVWNELELELRHCDQVATTLLGDVPYRRVGNTLEAIVPSELQSAAARNGLVIVGADHTRGVYILRYK